MAKSGRDRWVRVIGIFKALKGFLLLALATGGIKLLHKDLAEELTRWTERLNMDPHGHLLRAAIGKVSNVDSRKLLLYTIGTFIYAGLFLTEGIGLIMVKRWAEYFAVIITSSFLPIEIYEVVKKFKPLKIGIIVVNAAIVVYLIIKIKRGGQKHKAG
jgi:uncharacterized membrane protein (DUF2068 family)